MADVFGDASPVVVSPKARQRVSPIRSLSGAIQVLALVDDDKVEVSLPFPFWGETSVGITSNGYIGFPFASTSPNNFGSNLELVGIDYKGIFLTHDGYSSTGSEPYGTPYPDTACYYGSVSGGGWGVTWVNWGHCCDNYYEWPNTFQIVIWPDGTSEINVDKFELPADYYVWAGWRPGADGGIGTALNLPGGADGFHTYGDGDINSLADGTNTDVLGRWVYLPDTMPFAGVDLIITPVALADGAVEHVADASVTISPTALSSGQQEHSAVATPVIKSPAPVSNGGMVWAGNADPVIITPTSTANTKDDEADATAVVVSPTALAAGPAVMDYQIDAHTTVSPTALAEGFIVGSIPMPVTVSPHPEASGENTSEGFSNVATLYTYANDTDTTYVYPMRLIVPAPGTFTFTISAGLNYRRPIIPPPLPESVSVTDPDMASGLVMRPYAGVIVDMDTPTMIDGWPT